MNLDWTLAGHAESLEAQFDPETGWLRNLRLSNPASAKQEIEILRAIYVAVRDQNWGTVPGRLENFRSHIEPQHFRLTFGVECRQAGIHFHWTSRIEGNRRGELQCEFEGEALTSFNANRIGFCLLHPIQECVDQPARFETAAGQSVATVFPRLIDPQLPGQARFHDLRRLAHQIAPGLWLEFEFDGDVFEMEDQRNWTDASFKTYCTPLARPFPVEIPFGTRLRQRVTLRFLESEKDQSPKIGKITTRSRITVAGKAAVLPTVNEQSNLVVPTQPTVLLPKIGLGLASEDLPLTTWQAERLRKLRLSHLRLDLRLSTPDWPIRFLRGLDQARQVGSRVELVLHLPAGEADSILPAVRSMLTPYLDAIVRLLILRAGEPASTPATMAEARKFLGSLGRPLGGGTDAHFCELNREQALGRFMATAVDFISWPITPQVHAFDDTSVLETLEAQPDTVMTAQAFAPGTPLVVSPVTLKPRFNAVATDASAPQNGPAIPPADTRQNTLFCMVWTFGSLMALAEAGAHSTTWFETVGARGVLNNLVETATGRGAEFPVYHSFAVCAGYAGMAPLDPSPLYVSMSKQAVAAVCLFDAQGNRRVVLANLSGKPRRLPLARAGLNLETLTAGQIPFGQPAPLELSPVSQPLADSPRSADRVEVELPAHGIVWIDAPGEA